MESLFKKYLKGDPILWIVFIALCIISIIEMYSASSTLAYKAANHTAPMLKHVGFLFVGALIAFGVHLIPYRIIRLLAYIGLILSVFFLIFVLLKGKTTNDAARWVSIAGFQFQPSELAKLSVIVVGADLISRIKDSENDEWKYFRIILIVLGMICPLIMLENFSTAFILFGVVFLMMFIGKISLKKLGILAGVLILVALFGVMMLKVIPKEDMPKRFDRAYTWVNRINKFSGDKQKDENKYVITDDNRQVQRGRIAIARGGFFGVFPGNSVERDYLPQAYSDFIYAIIVEEMGMFGGIFVILLYLILLFRAGQIATKSTQVFPAILVIGLTLMIVIQAFVSMAVATSLGPVTGQPLPMISRGGTSILVTCIFFGIIFGVTREMKENELKQATLQNEPEREEKTRSNPDELPVIELDDL